MPPPPPPGPPAPPPPGPGARSQPAFKPKSGGNDRSALLKSIQNGTQLKKTVTNDRSAPIVGTVKNNTSDNSSRVGSGTGSSQSYGSNGSSNGPLPGIGGLFAGGMPTLKKTSGGVNTGRLTKLGQGEQNKVTNNFGNSKPLHSLSSSSLNSSSGVSLNKPPPPPSNDKPSVPSPSPSNNSPRTKTIGPVHPASKPPPPPEPGHQPGNPPSRSSKSFSQARPAATIGPGPQSRTPLPMQQSVSRDDISIQNGKLSNPPPPPVRTVSRAPPPPPTGKRPSQPPPPPPSSGRPPLRDLPPPPPPNHGQSMNGPPTPPTRRESIRKNETQSSSDSFESKFSGKFRSMQYLPPPELFSRCQKTYPSKTSAPVRQGSQLKRTQAPPPPPCKPPLPPGPPPARSWPATSVS